MAKLDDEAAGPDCLIGDFSPSTAVYCDLTDDQFAAGYLIQGQFGFAWLDNWSESVGACDSSAATYKYGTTVLMTQINDFMTGIPGLRDGGSVMLMGTSVRTAEGCPDLQPLGNGTGGLQASISVPTDPMIIRYPANAFSQFGDLPAAFAVGSSANGWDYDPWGYQHLQSLRRLVSADTGTTCTDRISTTTCDYFGSGGDQVDMAAYARYQDDSQNGIIFYMGGQQVNQSGNASHLRMVLNALIATPQGSSVPPTASITTEVARSTPVVGSLDGGLTNALYQGTLDVITPAEQVPTFSGAADASTFEFPYFRGHFRAIDVDDIESDANGIDFANVATPLWDAADGIPAVTTSGCSTPFTDSCRTIFTTTAVGNNSSVSSRPNQVYFNTSNASTLASLLSDSNVTLSTADASTLISRVMAGRDNGSGVYEAKLGGVDRSSVAIVEPNDELGHGDRPAVAYFGALDGMIHAVCAQTGGNCTSVGQELWAYIPRGQLPLLRLNRQRIDGSITVDEVYGDFDSDGTSEYRTVLTFQQGNPAQAAGISGQEPGVVAIDVTDPESPTVLWEVTAPATRGSVELGVGLDTAMGQVNISGTVTHTTFIQSSNGGTGGSGFIVLAINTVTGAEIWRYEHEYPNPRTASNPDVPFNGYPIGVSVYDATGAGYITNVLVPSLYGDVWKLDADTGESSIKDVNSPFDDLPLFRHSVDLRPISHPPAIFKEKSGSRLVAVVGSGGYQAIGSTLVWSPSSTTQYVVGVDVAGTSTVNETSTGGAVFSNALSAGERVFAQPTVAGNEIFVVSESANVNQLTYGQSGTNTGTLMRMQLNLPATTGNALGVTQTTAVSGGSGSAAVNNSTGVAYTGSGTSAKTSNLNSTAFDTGGTDVTTGVANPSGKRIIWLHL
jgi:hypothetical protein